jgi:ankyrin repeat protein
LIAAKYGKYEDAINAIKNGANINFQDGDGRTALIWGLINFLSWIKVKTTLFYIKKVTLFAKSGNSDIAIALINAGANLNLKDRWGETALIKGLKYLLKFA